MKPREVLKSIDRITVEMCWSVPFFNCQYSDVEKGMHVSAAAIQAAYQKLSADFKKLKKSGEGHSKQIKIN